MAKETDGKKIWSRLKNRLHSVWVQLGSMMLLAYLIPVVLLGIFTGTILLNRLEESMPLP